MNGFPDFGLRGVKKRKEIVGDGLASASLFEPDSRTSEEREDGGEELSINWEDNEEVVLFTLEFRIRNQRQYLHGVFRFPRNAIEIVNSFNTSINALMCERDPLPKTEEHEENPYHGNIVYIANLPGITRKRIIGTLAMTAEYIPPSTGRNS